MKKNKKHKLKKANKAARIRHQRKMKRNFFFCSRKQCNDLQIAKIQQGLIFKDFICNIK